MSITGNKVARAAWELDEQTLSSLLPESASGDDVVAVRRQFALWASTKALHVFESIASAWNDFISPRVTKVPAVLIPSGPCPQCKGRLFDRESVAHFASLTCRTCDGTGRARPRAIPAKPANNVALAQPTSKDDTRTA